MSRESIQVSAYDAGAVVRRRLPLASRLARSYGAGGVSGRKRGKVSGFSAHSRSRLRNWLVRAQYTGEQVRGITLTIPGIALASESECERIWHQWHMRANRMGVPIIWRKEVQARGAVHWHCIAWCDRVLLDRLRSNWWDSVSSLGEYKGPMRLKCGETVNCIAGSRMALPGAYEHCVAVDDDIADSGRALRYIADHASKRKQAQSKTTGRPWGIINRRRLPLSEQGEHGIDPLVAPLFRRLARRLYAYRVPADCVFGTRIERRSNARLLRKGEHVLIGNQSALLRLVRWCNSQAWDLGR